jgi:hypothetical protein
MKIRQLSDDEVARLSANYGDLIELLSRSELDTESILGILFKAAMNLAVTADYDKEEVLAVVAATYDMERFMRPSSGEVH